MVSFPIANSLMAQTQITAALTKNNTGLPGKNIFSPKFYPGLELGVIFNRQSPKKCQLGLFLGSYKKSYDSAVYLYPEISYNIPIQKFRFSPSFGLGGIYNFNNNPVFGLADSGIYEKNYFSGNLAAAARLGIGVAYELDSFNIGLKFYQMLQYPYNALISGVTRSSVQIILSKPLKSKK